MPFWTGYITTNGDIGDLQPEDILSWELRATWMASVSDRVERSLSIRLVLQPAWHFDFHAHLFDRRRRITIDSIGIPLTFRPAC